MGHLSDDDQFQLLSLYLEVLRDPRQRLSAERRDAFKKEILKSSPELRDSLKKYEDALVAGTGNKRLKSWGIEIDWISFQFATETEDGYFSKHHPFIDGSFVGHLSSATELLRGAVKSIEERLKLAGAKTAGYTRSAQLKRLDDLHYAEEVLGLLRQELDEFENTQFIGELQRSLRSSVNCWKKFKHLWTDVNALNAYLAEQFAV